MPTAAIIGAGPVGCLTALGLQQRGYEVIMFEGRTANDFAPSMEELTGSKAASSSAAHPLSRSINLAISVRGLTALRSVDGRLAQIVLDSAVPMRARMIHHRPSTSNTNDVELDSQLYSTRGECINSVSRLLLSRLLLDEVVAYNIPVRWAHKLRDVHFAESTLDAPVRLQFDTKATDGAHASHVDVDVVFGCDGHYSRVRRAIQAVRDLHVEETTVDNHYVELHIPPKQGTRNGYALDPNHLHIWPRHDFMLIALANRDGSFTSTLFAPQRIFDEHLRQPAATVAFFEEQFPDAVSVLGRDALVEQVCRRTPSSLGMIRCQSYNLDGRALILGDAAHAMVPFYGQGLNCGLEDVRIMLAALDRETAIVKDEKRSTASTLTRAFDAYSSTRHADLVAINALAMDNFREMSSRVVRFDYLLRKRLDGFLEQHLPQGWWSSLYTNVTFSNIGYHAARVREARQAALLHVALSIAALSSLAVGSIAALRASTWLQA